MQLNIYIPFQPPKPIALAAEEKNKQSSKDAPILAAISVRSNQQVIKPHVVLPSGIFSKRRYQPLKS